MKNIAIFSTFLFFSFSAFAGDQYAPFLDKDTKSEKTLSPLTFHASLHGTSVVITAFVFGQRVGSASLSPQAPQASIGVNVKAVKGSIALHADFSTKSATANAHLMTCLPVVGCRTILQGHLAVARW